MKQLILFLLLLLNIVSYSSNWHSLGYGTNLPVNTIFIDSTNSKLYAGGNFFTADSIRCANIAVWDGLHWDSMGAGVIYSSHTLAITKYQNQIYADGTFIQGNSGLIGGVFNGSTWMPMGSGTNGDIFQFKEVNNILWVCGRFNLAGSNLCPMIATWDGASWSCLNVPYWNELDDFEFYNGGLVIGGHFFDSTSTLINIAFYDSTNGLWSALGGGIPEGLSGVHALQIYRGDLYVAGLFNTASGNADNNIMRWDGTAWHSVGGGTDDEIYCMKVYNDELYIGGVFTQAGGIQTGALAKWNGSQWTAVTSSVFYPDIIEDIQFWNGELYVGGYFWTIDGVTVNNIARFDGLAGIENVKPSLNFSIFPNPSKGQIKISFSSSTTKNSLVIIKNLLGKEISQYNIPPQTMRKELDVSELITGIYFIIHESIEGRTVNKFIKE